MDEIVVKRGRGRPPSKHKAMVTQALQAIKEADQKLDPAMEFFPKEHWNGTGNICNPSVVNAILAAKRAGFGDGRSASIAGINWRTLSSWKKTAEDEISRRDEGHAPRHSMDKFILFQRAFMEASSAPLKAALSTITTSAAEGNTDTARWVAERMEPAEYAPIAQRSGSNVLGHIEVRHVLELPEQRLNLLVGTDELGTLPALPRGDIVEGEYTED